jgi:hypothetical protein
MIRLLIGALGCLIVFIVVFIAMLLWAAMGAKVLVMMALIAVGLAALYCIGYVMESIAKRFDIWDTWQ